MGKKRTFGPEFKLQVIEEAEAGIPIAELSRRYELTSGLIHKWKRDFEENRGNPFPGKGSRNTEKAKIAQMERLIGRQSIEIDFLKNALGRLKTQEG